MGELNTGVVTPPAAAPAAVPAPADGQTPGGDKSPELSADLNARYLEAVAKHESRNYQLGQTNKGLTGDVDALKAEIAGYKADPYKALEALGGNMDEYTQRVLNGNKPTPDSRIDDLIAKIGTLETQLTERSKTDDQRQQATQADQFFSSQAGEVSRLMEGPDYEDMRLHFGVEKDLFDVEPSVATLVRGPFEQHLKSTGQHMKAADSAALLLAQSKGLVDRIRNSANIKKIMGIEQAPAPGTTSAQSPSQQPQSRITNTLETTGGSTPARGFDEMEPAEFYKAADRLVGQ